MPFDINEYIDLDKKNKIINKIKHESLFTDKDFELLSTIRYDPNLSKGNGKFNSLLNVQDANVNRIDDMFLFDENVNLLDMIEGNLNLQRIQQEEEGDQYLDLNAANEQELMEIYYYRFFLLGEHLKRLQFTMTYFGLGEYEIDLRLLMDILLRAIPLQDQAEQDIIFEDGDEDDDITLSEIMTKLYAKTTAYKLRLLVNKKGDIRCEAYPITTKPPIISNYVMENLFQGFLDNAPTHKVYIYDTKISPSCFTSFKTTYRDHYNKAREQMAKLHEGQAGPCEILLFNTAGELMEGSISNCYAKFYFEDKWFYASPSLSTGCLCGVVRNFLVTKGIVTEMKRIDVTQLIDGDEILLSNGIMGVFKGQIVKPEGFQFKPLDENL
ncbi:uncharacterized protein HGUI_02142 [Hanseniaspora guilliermondii]|uniref:Aminodeoxychorismate lyase n=1 Tax=Hanseniaspora guilliermondii TaxID=56406 RepID=A0A1L0FK15_9ASCO|nr:uncharacterized protein HGUI_02142 [Hanseniaspora guilliermondii]